MPLISGSFEYGIVDGLIDGKASIGVGGYLAYTSRKHEVVRDYGYKYSNFIVGARGAFHYAPIPVLDTYGGAMLGYDIVSSSTYGTASGIGHYTADASEIGYSVFVGVRYFFARNIAVFAEMGYGVAPIEAGISFKF
ncbi:MAG: hypothetical protein LBK07_04810 [Tannerella sp.]|nr:hypothetical protein [Tannerella sp.]